MPPCCSWVVFVSRRRSGERSGERAGGGAPRGWGCPKAVSARTASRGGMATENAPAKVSSSVAAGRVPPPGMSGDLGASLGCSRAAGGAPGARASPRSHRDPGSAGSVRSAGRRLPAPRGPWQLCTPDRGCDSCPASLPHSLPLFLAGSSPKSVCTSRSDKSPLRLSMFSYRELVFYSVSRHGARDNFILNQLLNIPF